jgi:hypothetical protein
VISGELSVGQLASFLLYHLRVISIPTGILTWLRFAYVFESWDAYL